MRRRLGTWNRLFALLLGLSLSGSACGGASREDSASATSREAEKAAQESAGDPSRPLAPDFTLRDIDGAEVSLRDYRGKVVLLNFWATWCAPCRREIPDLIELQRERERDLVVLGVSLDREGVGKVKPFAEALKMTFPVLVDGDPVAEKFGPITGIPTTFVIDRHGRVARQIVGQQSKAYFEGILDDLVGES